LARTYFGGRPNNEFVWREVNQFIWEKVNLSVIESQKEEIKPPRLDFYVDIKNQTLAELNLALRKKIKIGRKKFLFLVGRKIGGFLMKPPDRLKFLLLRYT